jgi:hypothetical protein
MLCCAGEALLPHVPSILSAVAAGTSHKTAHVQTAALSVIEPLLPFVTDDMVPAFHQLLGALLPCAQAAVTAGNEDLLVQLCQVSCIPGCQMAASFVMLRRRAHRCAEQRVG